MERSVATDLRDSVWFPTNLRLQDENHYGKIKHVWF